MKRLQIDLRRPRVASRKPRRGRGKGSAGLYAIGGVSLILWVALGLWLATTMGFDSLATAFAGAGVAAAVLTLWRPAWYWNASGIATLRDALGDRGVLLVSLGLSGLLGAAGIHRTLRLDAARGHCAALLAAAQPGAARAAVYDRRIALGPTDWLRKSSASCRDILTEP